MRKNIFIILVLAVIIAGCSGRTEGELAPMFTIEPNTIYFYQVTDENGNHFDQLDHQIFNANIDGSRYHQIIIQTGTITDSVFDFGDNHANLIYQEVGNFFFVNKLNAESDTDIQIQVLQNPIRLNQTWDDGFGGVSTITNMSVEVEVPFGTFNAIEVTSDSAHGFRTVDYIVEGLGLVKRIQSGNNTTTIITSLVYVQEDADIGVPITVFVPDVDNNLIPHERMIRFNTNDDVVGMFEELFREDFDGYGTSLFTQNTRINSVEVVMEDLDNRVTFLDLSSEFITEMNAGAGLEMAILQGLADTIGFYSNTLELMLTIDGQNYSSGHIELGYGETIRVSSPQAD